MKINIVCVGKIKEQFFTDAIKEYLKRISRFADLKIIEVDEASKLTNLEQKSKAEGEKLLQKCSGVVVALDGGGKLLSSPEIADFLQKKEVQGEGYQEEGKVIPIVAVVSRSEVAQILKKPKTWSIL